MLKWCSNLFHSLPPPSDILRKDLHRRSCRVALGVRRRRQGRGWQQRGGIQGLAQQPQRQLLGIFQAAGTDQGIHQVLPQAESGSITFTWMGADWMMENDGEWEDGGGNPQVRRMVKNGWRADWNGTVEAILGGNYGLENQPMDWWLLIGEWCERGISKKHHREARGHTANRWAEHHALHNLIGRSLGWSLRWSWYAP